MSLKRWRITRIMSIMRIMGRKRRRKSMNKRRSGRSRT